MKAVQPLSTVASKRQPDTAAGRALLERESLNSRAFPLITAAAILAIEAEAYKASRDGLHPDAGNTEANHYDWFMPANPSGHVDAILDDFEAKLTEALTDPFVHDMAHSVLPLIAAYRALRDADKRRRAARTAQRARHYRASKARATPSDTPKEPT